MHRLTLGRALGWFTDKPCCLSELHKSDNVSINAAIVHCFLAIETSRRRAGRDCKNSVGLPVIWMIDLSQNSRFRQTLIDLGPQSKAQDAKRPSKGRNTIWRIIMSKVDLDCLAACNACADACDSCTASCLGESHVQAMTRCIALTLDCAALCRLTASFVARGSSYASHMCGVCAEICEACAQECAQHSHDHCKACAAACQECADACRRMLKTC